MDNSLNLSNFALRKKDYMPIKKFNSKTEALSAIKKAAERKRTLIEYLKKGYSAEELERMGFKMAKFA